MLDTIHGVDNKSDHSPLYCVLEFQEVQQQVVEQAQQQARPSWKKSSKEQKDSLKMKLEDNILILTTPESVSSCKNVKCRNPVHREELDTFTIELLEIVQLVAEENISLPKASSGNKNSW